MCEACHGMGGKVRLKEYFEESRKTDASNDVWCAASRWCEFKEVHG